MKEDKSKTEYVYHARRYWVQTPAKNQHVGWNTDFEPCVVFNKTTKRIGILSTSLGVLYLHREEFERNGKVYHSKPHEYFYRVKPEIDPEKTRFADSKVLKAFEALGLNFPAPAKEVKLAYKRKAKQAHPDKGGTGEAFLHLKNAFDIAIANV